MGIRFCFSSNNPDLNYKNMRESDQPASETNKVKLYKNANGIQSMSGFAWLAIHILSTIWEWDKFMRITKVNRRKTNRKKLASANMKNLCLAKTANFANKNKLLVTFAVRKTLLLSVVSTFSESTILSLSLSLFTLLYSLRYFLTFCQRFSHFETRTHIYRSQTLISICWFGHIINYSISSFV